MKYETVSHFSRWLQMVITKPLAGRRRQHAKRVRSPKVNSGYGVAWPRRWL